MARNLGHINIFLGLWAQILKENLGTRRLAVKLEGTQAYTLIRSYLENRQQFESINQSQSNLKPIRVGVPQGSSLGPMFFLIYINDLHNSLASEPRLFADDTCLLVEGSNSEQLEINLNAELHHLHLWCSVNKLFINSAKTNIVIIPPKQIKAPISHLNFSSIETPVNIVSCAKY